MAYSKAPHFDALAYQQSFWAKALGHPERIMILSHLLEHGVTAFYVLAKMIPLAKTTVSQHLRKLREDGLVESFDKYPYTYYRLNREACQGLAERIRDLNSSFLLDSDGHPGKADQTTGQG
jgi:ArsR family transcriptional regulator, arsenate/arsenite/antimonite-responsive transcriptional repressor